MSGVDKKSGLHLGNARKKEQINTMKQIIKDGVCPFCRENLEKYHTKPITFKTKHWVVTENAWPYDHTQKHFIIITQRHIKGPDELNAEEWKDVLTIQKRVREEFKLPSATLMGRCGDPASSGATVEHYHMHIISAESSDKPVLARVG